MLQKLWPYLVAVLVAAIVWRIGRKSRRKKLCAIQKGNKLAELTASGFNPSRQYDVGTAMLMVDEGAKQWVLLDYLYPLTAKSRPFSAIQATRLVSGAKVHGGVRRINEMAMLRDSLGAKNRETYTTETVQGLEITLAEPEEGQLLYLDCLDANFGAARMQMIFDTLIERA